MLPVPPRIQRQYVAKCTTVNDLRRCPARAPVVKPRQSCRSGSEDVGEAHVHTRIAVTLHPAFAADIRPINPEGNVGPAGEPQSDPGAPDMLAMGVRGAGLQAPHAAKVVKDERPRPGSRDA